MCRFPSYGLTVTALAALLGGCVPSQAMHGNGEDRLITAAQIDSSGARTAWDAVRKLLPQLNFGPGTINHRGQSSVVLTDAVAVILDGARLADYHALADIPADQVQRIRFISGIRGTTRYGLNSGDGVLVVDTKHGP